ncbi:MAG: serine dehydratase [Anaerolinea sp.]|nr:serine dehydratase [Anaerolinea sp.]
MKQLHNETPLIESRAMSLQTGRSIWLKVEAVQPSGSFKIRGVGYACQEYARSGATRFISSSGGNAGIAVAYAGRHLSMPVVVVVPETTTERAKNLILQEGAEVIVHGASWQDANALALSMVKESDAFIHPFDNPLLWQGHSTLIDEVVKAEVKPDVIVLSVGGGGLLCGVMEGLHKNRWQDVPVITVETSGADSFAQSVAANRLVELPAITSIATSLGARKVSECAFEWTRKHSITPLVVSDQEAVAACQRFIEDHRLVVEPACGAALAAVYGQAKEIEPYQTVLVIVCGGVGVSVDQLQKWSKP